MNTKLKMIMLAVSGLMTVAATNAQKPADKTKDKKETKTVTIVRSGDSDEKITVEIDGDKVLINGKPADQYKGDGVEVITVQPGQHVMTRGKRVIAAPHPPRVPMVAARGMHFSHNKAVLGVSTETDGGAKIKSVTKEGAAEKAGLKEGDVITKVGDHNVADADDLTNAIGKFNAGDEVKIVYKRDGKESTATAMLQKNTSQRFVVAEDAFHFKFDEGGAFRFSHKPRLGLQVQDLEEGSGVKVLDVTEETPAAAAGLRKDDVITSFNGKEIKSVDDLREAMEDLEAGDTARVTYQRAGATQNAEIKFPKPVRKATL